MLRDFTKIKNIKSYDFLYTIAAYLYYHIASKLPKCLKLRGKLLPRLHIYKDFFLESVYFVLDFREL